MTNKQTIADARAELTAAEAGNIMDRLVALERALALLLDLIERGR
jgi:hypothetical protein